MSSTISRRRAGSSSRRDRKSTRLNSSHSQISYAVFCLKKKKHAIASAASGPTLRGSGIDIDLRRDIPYSGYENFKFKVPVSHDGDVFARYMGRVAELRE